MREASDSSAAGLAAEAEHDPLGHVEPADAALALREVLAHPAVLGERAQRARREPDAGARTRAGRRPGAPPRRSPRSSCQAMAGTTGSPRPSSSTPVSAMLAIPMPVDRPAPGRRDRLPRGRDGGVEQLAGVDLRARRHGPPRRRGAALRELAAGVVERRRLDGGRAHVEPDEQRLAHHSPSPASGAGGRQRIAVTSPRSSPAPGRVRDQHGAAAATGSSPPSVASVPLPPRPTRIEKPWSSVARPVSRSARKYGSAAAGSRDAGEGARPRAGRAPAARGPSRASGGSRRG